MLGKWGESPLVVQGEFAQVSSSRSGADWMAFFQLGNRVLDLRNPLRLASDLRLTGAQLVASA
ncbi:hypothetical protein CX658_18820 [Pseudomonas amygdali pv. lachrymans]|nr:hypothetical protein CX658_18820 [Pseudomonas amygdali pv. lachrymans]